MANFHIDPSDNSDEDDEQVQARVCNTIESEGLPGVAVTLCLLPDVNVKVRPSHLSSFAVCCQVSHLCLHSHIRLNSLFHINIHFMFLVTMYQRM
jgi:hypothetical protein